MQMMGSDLDGLREDLPGEPRAGGDPLVAGPAPALVDVEPAIVDRHVPAPDEAIPNGAFLVGVAEGHRVVAQPPGADDRRGRPVLDAVTGPVADPVLRPADTVPARPQAGVRPAGQVAPGVGHSPRPGRARSEHAERPDVPVDLSEDVVHAAVLVDRRERVAAVAAVLAVQAIAARPIRVAEAGLAVGPAEEHGPGHGSAAHGATAVLELVVVGDWGRCPPVGIGHGYRPPSVEVVRRFDGDLDETRTVSYT